MASPVPGGAPTVKIWIIKSASKTPTTARARHVPGGISGTGEGGSDISSASKVEGTAAYKIEIELKILLRFAKNETFATELGREILETLMYNAIQTHHLGKIELLSKRQCVFC